MHKCINCGFEPADGLDICPECGFSLNILKNDDPENKNDEIEWSKLEDVPIESVQNMFKEAVEQSGTETEDGDTNDVLAQYIREHKVAAEDKLSPDEEEQSEAEVELEEESEAEAPEDPIVEVAETSEEPLQETPSPKKHTRLYVTLAVVAVLGAGGGYYYYHEKEVEAQKIATIKSENQAIDAIESELTGFYTDKDQHFIKPEKVQQDTQKLAETIQKHKDSGRYAQVKKAYDTLDEKKNALQKVNQLFTAAAVNGDKLAEKPLLKEAKPVDLTIKTADTAFDSLLNQAISSAQEQYTMIETAQTKVSALLKDGTVADSANWELYNQASAAVGDVWNQELVRTQKENLAQVNEALVEKDKKAAATKAAATPAPPQPQPAQAVAQATLNLQRNKNNQPLMAENKSQTSNVNDPAWGWNAGVREKVIQTCIQRGYIVDGGYALQPVQIINGEGYYNLYATSNQAPLTKGYKQSEMPIYLVTVNCKTGWFQGNGSR